MTSQAVRHALVTLVLLAFTATAGGQELELEDCRISIGPGNPGTKARCGTLLRKADLDGRGTTWCPACRVR